MPRFIPCQIATPQRVVPGSTRRDGAAGGRSWDSPSHKRTVAEAAVGAAYPSTARRSSSTSYGFPITAPVRASSASRRASARSPSPAAIT